ncbi:MAG: OmpA family protein [Bacteroidetes bacterium]|nr:OmpA family protein [Bacteroidota bacterium]MBI3481913.1 OmpA family protein [Bacteroidota bacterium]
MKRLVILCVLLLASVDLIGKTTIDHRKIKMVSITGKVIDDASKAPVATKLTIVVKGFDVFEITTDSKGEFSTSIPESSKCEIIVHAPGFESQDDVVDLAQNATHYIEIHLIPFVKLTIDGMVVSSKDHRPIKAELKVYRNSDFIQEDDKIIQDGKYSEALTNFGWYLIDFSATGYVDELDTLWVLSFRRKIIHKDYELTPIEKGLTVQLKNIYFNFGKSSINPDSNAELDRLVEFFNQNPSMHVEIAGHTDSDGPDDYNLLLSQARAQEVVNYLMGKGVSKDQLVARGYGETKPIDSNATLPGKANNRRVEMVVIDK